MKSFLPLMLFMGLTLHLQGQNTKAPVKSDAFFSRDKHWRGGDGAASIPLGNGRILWLFGDSFISAEAFGKRKASTLIRNSIGIQEGPDMKSASISYYWDDKQALPSSFFRDTDSSWFWPGHGILIKDRLLIFLMDVHRVTGGLGFEASGWAAVLIENPKADPRQWKMTYLKGRNSFSAIAGSSAVLQDSTYLYAYAVVEPATHEVHLMRWTLDQAYAGNLSEPEYWADSKWIAQQKMQHRPDVLFTGSTEFSVHYDAVLKKYIQVQSFGFGKASIGIRLSDRPEGKWSEPIMVYTPDYVGIRQPFMYSAKAHPEQKGNGLCITYNINSFDFEELLEKEEIYFPKRILLKYAGSRANRYLSVK